MAWLTQYPLMVIFRRVTDAAVGFVCAAAVASVLGTVSVPVLGWVPVAAAVAASGWVMWRQAQSAPPATQSLIALVTAAACLAVAVRFVFLARTCVDGGACPAGATGSQLATVSMIAVLSAVVLGALRVGVAVYDGLNDLRADLDD